MAAVFAGWLNGNEARAYPLHERGTRRAVGGGVLPNNLLVDAHICLPKSAGNFVYLSSVGVTSKLVSLTFAATWNSPFQSAPSSAGEEGFTPVAVLTLVKPVTKFKNYRLTPMYPGVGGWVALGGGINLSSLSLLFDGPEATQLLDKAVRTYDDIPVTSLSKLNVSSKLTGLVRLQGQAGVIRTYKAARSVKTSLTLIVSTFAGAAGQIGSADGLDGAARFYSPASMAIDSAGNIFVADTYNYTIRKITPAGMVSTLAGAAGSQGYANGQGAAARFYLPTHVAVDSSGNVYVTEDTKHAIRKITPEGLVSAFAGTAASSGHDDGPVATALFSNPGGMVADSLGNLYLADSNNGSIRKITPEGIVSTLAGNWGHSGCDDGQGTDALFYYPYELAVDSLNNLYAVDYAAQTVRKITPGGLVSTLAGLCQNSGSSDGDGANARFYSPASVAVDKLGNVYVADYSNYTVRKITPGGTVSTLAGLAGQSGAVDGLAKDARFFLPLGIAVDGDGNIFVTDSGNCIIRKISVVPIFTAQDVAVVGLDTSQAAAKLASFAGICGHRPQSHNCNRAPLTSINGVRPDANGNIDLEFAGDGIIGKGQHSIVVDFPVGLREACLSNQKLLMEGCPPGSSSSESSSESQDLYSSESSIAPPAPYYCGDFNSGWGELAVQLGTLSLSAGGHGLYANVAIPAAGDLNENIAVTTERRAQVLKVGDSYVLKTRVFFNDPSGEGHLLFGYRNADNFFFAGVSLKPSNDSSFAAPYGQVFIGRRSKLAAVWPASLGAGYNFLQHTALPSLLLPNEYTLQVTVSQVAPDYVQIELVLWRISTAILAPCVLVQPIWLAGPGGEKITQFHTTGFAGLGCVNSGLTEFETFDVDCP